MSSQVSNQELVQKLYAAFGRGDVGYILDACSANIEWECVGPAAIPYGGRYTGKQGVEQFFMRLGQACDFKKFEPRDFVAQGNNVVVLGYEEAIARATGRSYQTSWVQVFTIQDGKLVRFREFADSYAVAMAFQGTPIPDGVVH
jgi:uncharacterized protein